MKPPVFVEGVPYWTYRVQYRLRGRNGARRSFMVQSPGGPWVRSEVGRMLEDLNDVAPIRHGSATIEAR